jgi:hypothetical protein
MSTDGFENSFFVSERAQTGAERPDRLGYSIGGERVGRVEKNWFEGYSRGSQLTKRDETIARSIQVCSAGRRVTVANGSDFPLRSAVAGSQFVPSGARAWLALAKQATITTTTSALTRSDLNRPFILLATLSDELRAVK